MTALNSESPKLTIKLDIARLRRLRDALDAIIENDGELDAQVMQNPHSQESSIDSDSKGLDEVTTHAIANIRDLESRYRIASELSDSFREIMLDTRTRCAVAGLCGIYRLPDDVLTYLFTWCTPEYLPMDVNARYDLLDERARVAFALSQTCRRFRITALDEPTLWNVMSSHQHPQVLEILMDRGQSAGLHISWGKLHTSFGEFASSRALFSMLRGSQHWLSLRFIEFPRPFLQLVRFITLNCGQLQTLNLVGPPDPVDSAILECVQGTARNLVRCAYPAILTSHGSFKTDLGALMSFRALDYLNLSILVADRIPNNLSGERYTFPGLRHLWLRVIYPRSQNSPFTPFGMIHTPNLIALDIFVATFRDPLPLIKPVKDDLLKACEHLEGLKSLRILAAFTNNDVWGAHLDIIDELLQRLPNLRALRISGDIVPPLKDTLTTDGNVSAAGISSLTHLTFERVNLVDAAYVRALASVIRRASKFKQPMLHVISRTIWPSEVAELMQPMPDLHFTLHHMPALSGEDDGNTDFFAVPETD